MFRFEYCILNKNCRNTNKLLNYFYVANDNILSVFNVIKIIVSAIFCFIKYECIKDVPNKNLREIRILIFQYLLIIVQYIYKQYCYHHDF